MRLRVQKQKMGESEGGMELRVRIGEGCDENKRSKRATRVAPSGHPKPGLAVGAGRDEPREGRVPLDVEDSEPVADAVAAEDFERDNEGVLQKIRVDGPVEDVDGAIVGARREERV